MKPNAAMLTSTQGLLEDLLSESIVLPEEFQKLAGDIREGLSRETDPDRLLAELSRLHLLTAYQVGRIRAGKLHELVIGNYRLLQLRGTGGMGSVFEAEHVRLRQLVAIKVLVLPPLGDWDSLLSRFLAEMRAVAQLQHPNIVAAKDAGEVAPRDPDAATLHYFVMEYVPGLDLEEFVEEHGPMPVSKACDVIYQIASALAEAHHHQLIHRDVKPPNILLTPEGQAKLLDFGLARHSLRRLTDPGTVLGSADYMAPEQARDSTTVDCRTDIYGLGGTLYWCLTGQRPFPRLGNNLQSLLARLNQEPPSAQEVRAAVPAELDAVLRCMMAVDPQDRFPSAQALMQALAPFLPVERSAASMVPPSPPAATSMTRTPAVLLVDDEAGVRSMSHMVLGALGWSCVEAADGVEALDVVRQQPFDLLVIDVDMPRLGGLELLKRLRAEPPWPNLKIMMVSGRSSSDEMAQMMLVGADDYLTKPFSVTQLRIRAQAAMNLKDAQDRAELLAQHSRTVHAELERALIVREHDQRELCDALVLSLASLAESRHIEAGGHRLRMQRYCRCLGEALAADPVFAGQVDAAFVDLLVCCAPLHDIGNIGVPDHILNKPGRYDADERLCMQMHTVLGADALRKVAERHRSLALFLRMAIDIVHHHHERFDGTGYPDRLAGEEIPLAARVVALADVYDALRSRKVYRPALTHTMAVKMMSEGSPGQFDPRLLSAFHNLAKRFDAIFAEVPAEASFSVQE